MGHDPPSPELQRYIDQFTKNAKESFKRGDIEVIMVYGHTCPVCHMQFNHFKNYMAIDFDRFKDGKLNGKEKENKEMVADRILPVTEEEPLGKVLIAEADSWAKEFGNPDLEIKYTPTFLDAKTHEKIAQSFQAERPLKDALNRVKLQRRRKDFKDTYSNKVGRDCEKVACGLKASVTITDKDLEEEKKSKDEKDKKEKAEKKKEKEGKKRGK